MQPTFPSKFLEKIPQVGDIVSFRLERPEGYQYQAGQWLVITFAHPPGEPSAHHFSHSNSPTEPVLEFTTRLRGSEFKDALDALPVGAEVELEGPYGSFTLPEEVERVAFLTGGIGAASCVAWQTIRPRSPSPGRSCSSSPMALSMASRSERNWRGWRRPFSACGWSTCSVEREKTGADIAGISTNGSLQRRYPNHAAGSTT